MKPSDQQFKNSYKIAGGVYDPNNQWFEGGWSSSP
jgi:hypothetical protein